MQRSLTKYRIGFGLIGLFGLVLVIVVVLQAGATKTDNNTYNKASAIADKLNNYTIANNIIPDSLSSIGVTDIPSTVSYSKLSDSSFRFCVTYKTTSSGFDASAVEGQLLTQTLPGDYSGSAPTDNSYLYLDPNHHKGQNCQTINPAIYNNLQNNINSGTDFSSPVTTN